MKIIITVCIFAGRCVRGLRYPLHDLGYPLTGSVDAYIKEYKILCDSLFALLPSPFLHQHVG